MNMLTQAIIERAHYGALPPSPDDTESAFAILDPEMHAFISRANQRDEKDRRVKEQREYEADICAMLSPKLAFRLSEELASLKDRPSTRRVYTGDCKRFKQYCDEVNMTFRPAAPEIVSSFLLEEYDSGSSINSIHRTAAAIGYGHRVAKVLDPTQDILVRATVRHIAKHANGKPANKEH